MSGSKSEHFEQANLRLHSEVQRQDRSKLHPGFLRAVFGKNGARTLACCLVFFTVKQQPFRLSSSNSIDATTLSAQVVLCADWLLDSDIYNFLGA